MAKKGHAYDEESGEDSSSETEEFDEDENLDEVDNAVQNLNKTNEERQSISERVTTEVKEQIGEVGDRKVLFALGSDWPMGIVGLVAGKITDKFWRPTFVMVEKDGTISGSGRSIPEFDITSALQKAKKYLSKIIRN